MDDYDDDEVRITPQNDLDLQMLLTDPKWGTQIPKELREKLTQINKSQKQHLWGLLSYYNRDIRLGNLSVFNGEVEYVRYFIDLAGDCLRAGYIRSFLKSLSLAVTVLETSQSKGGFLRKRHGTISKEEFKGEMEPQKRGLLGTRKRDGG